jgi:peroxiredoxin/outer membrane lipoprotein-sorting protein
MTTAGSSRQACLAFGKIGFAGFLFFSPQSPGIGPVQSESQAMEVIRKMSETYRALRSYEFEGVLKLESKAEGFQKTREIPFLKAAVLPGKLRIERGGPKNRTMLVCDGENSWLYFPPHYSKTAPGDMKRFLEQGPAEEPGTMSALHNTFVNQYTMMTETAKRARILGEESLDLSGDLKTCYVVGLDDVEAPDSAAGGVFPRTLWIEKDRLIVLKEISTSRTESPRYGSTLEIRQTLTLHLAKINEPLAEDLFVFTPSADVREIFLPGLGPPSHHSLEGEMAKDFSLQNFKGEPVNLKNLRGKVVLLNFWATWCAPCRIEMPFLDRLQNEFRHKRLVVLGITDEEPELAEAFLARHQISFSNVSDRQQEVATLYQVRAIPTVFIINREGKIVYHGIGVSREDAVRRALKEAGIETQ